MTSYLAQFFYQLNGPEDGRKWVFLHGLMGYASNWRKIVLGLETSERILTFDQRGHGRSMKPLTGYASEDYADDLQKITDELGWQKFILVGHSMGGRNALIFAHKYPQKVDRLVIEDIGPDSNMNAISYYEGIFKVIPTPFASRLKAKEYFMNEFPKSGIQHENILVLGQYLYSNIEDKPDGTADWRFSSQAILASVIQGRAKEAWSELRTLTMPTLVVRGERSKELSREVFDRMCVSNPQIRGVEVSNAGHWIHADQPHEFQRILREFADQSF